jgi:hypothetical protein
LMSRLFRGSVVGLLTQSANGPSSWQAAKVDKR